MTTASQRATTFFSRQQGAVGRLTSDETAEALIDVARGNFTERARTELNFKGFGNKHSRRSIENSALRAGVGLIRIKEGVNQALVDWLDLAAPAVLETIVEDFLPLVEHAHATAPRDSGKLQDLQIVNLDIDDGLVSVEYVAVATYARLVQYRGGNRKKGRKRLSTVLGPAFNGGVLDVQKASAILARRNGTDSAAQGSAKFNLKVLSFLIHEMKKAGEVEPTKEIVALVATKMNIRRRAVRGIWFAANPQKADVPQRGPEGQRVEGKTYWTVQAERPFKAVARTMEIRLSDALTRAFNRSG